MMLYTVLPRFLQGFLFLTCYISFSAARIIKPPFRIAPTIGEIFNISCIYSDTFETIILWKIWYKNVAYNLSNNSSPDNFQLITIENTQNVSEFNYYLNSTLSFIITDNSDSSFDDAIFNCDIHDKLTDRKVGQLRSQITEVIVRSTPAPPHNIPVNLTISSPNDGTLKLEWAIANSTCVQSFNVDLKRYSGVLDWSIIDDLDVFATKEIFQGHRMETQFTDLDIGYNYIFRVEAVCNTENIQEFSEWTDPLLLLMHQEASISNLASKKTVTEGDSVSIECLVLGFPKPEVHWSKEGDFRVNGSTLSFESITIRNSGVYRCLVSNVVNGLVSTTSESINIIVLSPEPPTLIPSNCSNLVSRSSVCSPYIPYNQSVYLSRHLLTLCDDISATMLQITGSKLDVCYQATMSFMCNTILLRCDPLLETERKSPEEVMCREDCLTVKYGDCHSKFGQYIVAHTDIEDKVPDCSALTFKENNTCNFLDINSIINPTVPPFDATETSPPLQLTIIPTLPYHMYIVIGSIVGFALFVIFSIIAGIIIFYLYYRRVSKPHFCSSRFIDSNISDNPFYLPFTNKTSLVEKKEFPRSSFKITKKLGQGHFGIVELAEAKSILPGERVTLVATKTLQEGATLKDKMDFEREAEIMLNFDHPNILRLLGVSFKDKNLPMCLLFEYMENGDLNNYLRGCGSFRLKRIQNPFPSRSTSENESPEHLPILTTNDLVNISSQVSGGMKYLSDRCFVHRDLATRNCLVGGNMIVKIGDFGMSKDVYKSDYYRIGKDALLPIKWMAPEAIMYGKATIQTDIWSFGVLMWEVFSFAMQPWYGCTNEQVIEKVKSGSILARPDNSPQLIYSLMLECWKADPDQRINFTDIDNRLSSWNVTGITETVPTSDDVAGNSANNPFVVDPFFIKAL